MPRVSVIIPSYNRAPYIQEAVESVLSQTHKDVEIIVVDDGSTDHTREVLQPYIARGQVIYVPQANAGVSVARNNGLRRATGEFIKFLDSDDMLYPEQLERQLRDIAGEANVVSLCDFTVRKPNGEEELKKTYLVARDRQFASFIESNRGVIHAFLTPKHCLDAIGGFDERLESCEDLDLWIQILKNGATIKHLPFNGCCYRILEKSLSANTEHMFLQKCKVYEKINADVADPMAIPGHLADSIFAINSELLTECVARNMRVARILPGALRVNTRMYQARKKGMLKALLKVLGVEQYLKLRQVFNKLTKRNYTEHLLNGNYRWKYQ